ncbi:hypothetical protein ACFUCV_13605 [Specibacter sp. NPDC057265]|uniref:hypothetical protein n=1 Tax=Specibacter sp. NPDC057265 TaxID=3346075 RepID=UPI00362DD7B5
MDTPQETAQHQISGGTTSVEKLWISYIANGGTAPPLVFEAIIYGALRCDGFDLQVLSLALRDRATGPQEF